ncbi:MAG: TetR/AcrR family transcriptional regulator [Leptospirales bacterium]|nr:TetR/AcrR family transcriptional regulator [Leptospirales bacterium]
MGIAERKEREKQERRRAILDNARQLIQEKPYEDITMEDLARRLELSRATLYLYFRNKNEIYATMLAEGLRELEAGYQRVLSSAISDPMDRLKGFALVFFDFYTRNHSYFDLIVTKRSELLKDVAEDTLTEFEKAGQSVIQPLVNVYQEGVLSGRFPAHPPDKMAWMLRAVAIGFAVGIREGKIKFPEDLPLAEELLLYGMRGRPEA